MSRLQDKVAIVTGGARGIGAAAVELFHQEGAKVVIADIQDALGQALADRLRGGGTDDSITYIHCDVSKEDDVARLVDATVARYGKLDVMYCNAGISDGRPGSILDATREQLDRMIGVNLVGAFLGAKHAARVMIPMKRGGGGGSVLFTASACTAIGGLGSHCYAMTKYGIVGLARNLASELGRHGVRVNCVSPSGVVTTGVGGGGRVKSEAEVAEVGNLKGRNLTVDDVARAALFLASDEARYVSGVNLLVDGGFSTVNPSMLNAMQIG
ncbi:unnamed protein product [Linum tenue]|uniref:Uncharacterized protein n=1 Tax=Linum tenue TaxID=586396 RepID=A0AAV0PQJ1_9ROSI|nr:unnamed protein product [Linum tenue]